MFFNITSGQLILTDCFINGYYHRLFIIIQTAIKSIQRCCHHHFRHAALRLHSTVHRHHPPQRTVLSQICCFGERKVVLFQILLDGAEPRDAGRPGCLLQSAGGGGGLTESSRHLHCHPCAMC